MRFAAIASLAIMAPLALVGCSSSAPKPVSHRPVSGTELRLTLVTAVPQGFTQNKTATIDSGDELLPASTAAMKSKSHCSDLNATAFIQDSGVSGVGFAQSDYLDAQQNEISQEVDSFTSPAAAAKAMAAMTRFFRQCAKFTYKQDGTNYSVKFVTATAGGLGAGAVKGTMTSSTWVGGSTLVVAQQGPYVITAFYSTRSSSYGSEILGIVSKIEKNLGGTP